MTQLITVRMVRMNRQPIVPSARAPRTSSSATITGVFRKIKLAMVFRTVEMAVMKLIAIALMNTLDVAQDSAFQRNTG